MNEFSIPLPDSLDEDGFVSKHYCKMKSRFENFANETDDSSTSFLLFIAKNFIQDTIASFHMDSLDIDTLYAFLTKIESFCLPRFLLLFERYRFLTLHQIKEESFNDFLQRIVIHSKRCEFGEDEGEFQKVCFASGISNESLRSSLTNLENKDFRDAFISSVSSEKVDEKDILRAEVSETDVRSSTTSSLAKDTTISVLSGSQIVSCPRRPIVKRGAQKTKHKNTKGSKKSKSNDVKQPMKRATKIKNVKSSGKVTRTRQSERRKTSKGQPVYKANETSPEQNNEHIMVDRVETDDTSDIIKTEGDDISSDASVGKSVGSKLKRPKIKSSMCMLKTARHHKAKNQARETKKKGSNDCLECNETFRNSYQLKLHTTMMHSGGPQHMCDECGKCFHDLYRLGRHKFCHTGIRPHKCETCGKGFKTAGALDTHSYVHSKEPRCACEVCGKTFRSVSSFSTHKLIHTGVKRHGCPVCGWRTNSTSDLAKHTLLHTNLTPFECETCGKKFKWRSNYRTHQKVHTQTLSYFCNECGMAFVHYSTFRKHRKKHSQEQTSEQTSVPTTVSNHSWQPVPTVSHGLPENASLLFNPLDLSTSADFPRLYAQQITCTTVDLNSADHKILQNLS